MTELIYREVIHIIIMLLCGLGIMLIFTSIEVISRRLKGERVRTFMYLLSWLIVSKFFSDCLFLCANGKLRVYSICATAIGILLWKKTIYDIISKGR